MKLKELYQSVTDTIIRDLEAGVPSWVRPWTSRGGGALPYNYATRRPYSGINIPILWAKAIERGWPNGWMTYRQAGALGAHVRSGERATTIVFTKKLLIEDDDEANRITLLKTFAVFNQSQIDCLPMAFVPPVKPMRQPDDEATRFIQSTHARILHGGDRACYHPHSDTIALPEPAAFDSYQYYLATALHELVHWSGADTRLGRDLTGRFGTSAYAAEELIAELGAAFLCARLGVEGRLRHAEYIANWLTLLRTDPRAIFTAAAKAQQATDYLASIGIADVSSVVTEGAPAELHTRSC
jgi:antirestriction protein ArdC